MRTAMLLSLLPLLAACTTGVENAEGTCPDASDPDVHYASHDPSACASADLGCAEGQHPFDDACGCGCIGPGSSNPSTCPDPADPLVHYVAADPSACAAALFACNDEQTTFDDECGCGCIGPEDPSCPASNDPNVHYVSHDPQQCAAADFACAEGQTMFSNECGCGCLGPEPGVCPDPNDPSVHYISQSVDQCALIDFACDPWQKGFSNGCGCGCIDTACTGLSATDCAASLVCSPIYQALCDCACPDGEPGCPECPAECFAYGGCAFAGE